MRALIALFFISLISSSLAVGQVREIVLMCYNVENLCDTIDDHATADDEFTPEGAKQWNSFRYKKKLRQITEVISSVGDEQWPALVGLVEVETSGVVEDLLNLTALRGKGYQYTMTHRSLDPRGMDIALLYREPLRLDRAEEYPIPFEDASKRSRNILYARFCLEGGATLNILLAHLPSRRGGARASEPYRQAGARLMRHLLDSLYQPNEPWVIMGDFNGDPDEKATAQVLGARLTKPLESAPFEDSDSVPLLFNLTAKSWLGDRPYGSYCYQGVWSQLDQFLLSSNLLSNKLPLQYVPNSVQNFAPDWLTAGKKHAGRKPPFRTYAGSYYNGGYSDHFPISLRLRYVQ